MPHESSNVKRENNAGDLLSITHRLPEGAEGFRAHFWTHTGRYGVSEWFPIGDGDARKKAFSQLPAGDCYFSVNPSYRIPPHNKSGNTNPRFIAKQAEYIGAVNVFYVEFDGKDYVKPEEYAAWLPADYDSLDDRKQKTARKTAKECAFYLDPDIYKARAWESVMALPFTPARIIDSGGGYHCYIALAETVMLDESNRGEVAMLQSHFVAFCAGDMGAHDLSRVLRLPGTRNHKDGWGSVKPVVKIVGWNDVAYEYSEIEVAVYDWLSTQKKPLVDLADTASDGAGRSCAAGGAGTVRSMFNAANSVVKLLVKKGYAKIHETKNKDGVVVMTRLGRPGKEKVPSVTVLPANDDKPEIAICWSGNDDLHGGTVVDADGNAKQRGHDAYSIFTTLYCDGNGKQAWIQAKKFLGLWG